MTKSRVFVIVQSILCFLIVILLANAAIGILLEGSAWKAEHPLDWIYSREKVAERVGPILPLIFFAFGVTISGILLEVTKDLRPSPVKDQEVTRDLMVARVAQPSEAMKKEQALQKKIHIGGWVLFAVCMIPILLYVTRAEHFPGNADLEKVIGALVLHVLPWTVIGIGSLMVSTTLLEKSMVRETEAASARMKEEKAAGTVLQARSEVAGNRKGLTVFRLVFLIAAVLFIIAGVINGGASAVLSKAINICTECVGLG
ncbi:MAG: hypothetical protein IJ088_01205, partial [Clostridia bacterium]|nr:hypothetical protein [Clostridia bacterium]